MVAGRERTAADATVPDVRQSRQDNRAGLLARLGRTPQDSGQFMSVWRPAVMLRAGFQSGSAPGMLLREAG